MLLTPAIQLFVSELSGRAILGQLEIRRAGESFTLRHLLDSEAPESSLTRMEAPQLRSLAMFTSSGAFRPLRSAPDLQRGWIATVGTLVELERALNDIYPGALSDWHAVRTGFARFTSFRAFAQRQTGLYGSLREINDPKAEVVAAACCANHACSRQRFWTVDGRKLEQEFDPSRIPCLEPCAVFMEFARQAHTKATHPTTTLQLNAMEVATLVAALQTAAAQTPERQADFKNPLNVRRVLLCLENHAAKLKSRQPAKDPGSFGIEEKI